MRVVLVTGTDQGLGLETSRQLIEEGCYVLMGALNAQAAPALEGGNVIQLDVTKEQQMLEAYDRIQSECGKLDVLINNAAVLNDVGVQPSEVTDAQLYTNFDVNFFGPWKLTQVMLPLLKKAEKGSVLNLATQVATFSQLTDPDSPLKDDICPAYQSSKIALNALTALFAKEYAEYGISVNSICPGWVMTDMGHHEELPDYGDEVRPLTPEEACRIIVETALNPKGTATFTSGGDPVDW